MVIHIFPAKNYVFATEYSKGLIRTIPPTIDQYFILYSKQALNPKKYEQFYKELNFKNYHFCFSHIDLAIFLFHSRKEAIVFHSENYINFVVALLCGCKNVSWVCWGSGASVKNSLRSRLFAPFKKLMYPRFTRIITLMDCDRKSIIRDFHIDPSKIETIPYAFYGEIEDKIEVHKNARETTKNTSSKPIVLLGNSPLNIKYYIDNLHVLSHFKGQIVVHCMMNYKFERNDDYYTLLETGKKYFGEDFKTDEKFYNGLEEYVNYMNTSDIYICGCPNQTGLGALYSCLQLGKKVYLTGKNYEWATDGLKAVVKKISDIKDIENFIAPLSKDEIEHNIKCIVDMYNNTPHKWMNIIRLLNTSNH